MGMVKNGCGQPSDGSLKLTVSQKRNRWNKLIFLYVTTNSGKLKVDSMIFGWALSKMAIAC